MIRHSPIKKLLPWLLLVAALALGYVFRNALLRLWFSLPTPSSVPRGLDEADLRPGELSVVAEGLDVPWGIAFLPNGDLLVTERSGTLRRIGKDGGASVKVEGVVHLGEGGLLGVALHPLFEQNRQVYLYMTSEDAGGVHHRVERYRLENDRLTERMMILKGIPASAFHGGGGLAFGPEGLLYVSTGDAEQPELAQDVNSLAGKILRLKEDGGVPGDNPFDNAVWSYGHRNVQGFAWDGMGRMWATEHGRSGLKTGFDELNLIEPGENYGWPEIQGEERREGMRTAVRASGSRETWAPAGMTYMNGSFYFAGLRGQALYEARPTEGGVAMLRHFHKAFGRLRTVAVGPDGHLYVATANTDGRGKPREGDDRIYRLDGALFSLAPR